MCVVYPDLLHLLAFYATKVINSCRGQLGVGNNHYNSPTVGEIANERFQISEALGSTVVR